MNLALCVALPAMAATSGGQESLKELGMQVKNACQSDINKFCKDVTPGGGRIKSCLDSKEDRLSADCVSARAEAREKISQRMDRAEVAFRKSCGEDVRKFCSDVPSGKGRLMDCLDRNKDHLSSSCSEFQSKAREKLSKSVG